ncbi:MAG: hypothetical protein OHK0050_00360 [Roseiflexaceae bacterium]
MAMVGGTRHSILAAGSSHPPWLVAGIAQVQSMHEALPGDAAAGWGDYRPPSPPLLVLPTYATSYRRDCWYDRCVAMWRNV